MRVLIGYDGSVHSGAAIEDLKLAGLPRDTEALVVSVGDLIMSSPPARQVAAQLFTSRRAATAARMAETHGGRIAKEAEALAAKASGRLRSEFPGWVVNNRVLTGTPAVELVEAADEWKADLIVVGSEGRSALDRFLLGSVSKTVVADARCSVRVARPTVRRKENSPPKIVIGIDGSQAAEEAVHEVGRRIWPSGTQVRLMAVQDYPSPGRIAARLPQAAEMIADINLSAARRAESMLEWAAYQLRSIGIDASISIQRGAPDRIILREASKWNADCIFVGTRDFKNAFERFRLGSVSTAVTAKARCSVEIVRPREKPED
jgi:nucleotide-binding universal stress UspA family protein